MKNSIVFSTGSYLPEKVVMNADLTQFSKDSLPRIAQKTGVLARRIASEDECTSDLGIKAAQACLDKVAFPVAMIDGIIVSTSSPDRIQPPTASRVQAGIGAHQAFAFDFNSVCSGSTYGISLADSFIRSGRYENILFVAAEMYSRILWHKDFGTLPYFGDGAGAILFRADNSDRGVTHSCLGTDGASCEVLGVHGCGTMQPHATITDPRAACLKMNGRAVYEFAMKRGTEVILKLAKEAGISVNDVDCFIPHQANINIIKGIAAEIGVPSEKFFVNLFHYGNTASASVLIALDEAIAAGIIRKGDLVMTVAFGGGLSWGANLIRM